MSWKNTTNDISSQVNSRYETPLGAQEKADAAEEAAKAYTDNKLALPELPIQNGSIVERHIRSENITERTIAQKAVTRSKIGTGAVGSQELDQSLLQNFGDIAVQAEFDKRGINVQKFGAKGDEVTDDTNSFLNCANYCISNNLPMFIPSGTFIIDSNKLIFRLSLGQSLIIFGVGELSEIKRKNNSITGDFQELIDISTDGTGNAESIHIYNLSINSNATNNMPPGGSDSFDWEHCADIRINGQLNSNIKSVSLHHIWFKDAVADHVYFAGSSNCYVDRADIYHIYAKGRTRKRSDITITGGMSYCVISNCDLQKFEVELNTAYDGEQPMILNITNMQCVTIFDVIGKNLYLQIDNLITYDLSLRFVKGIMSNSKIYIPKIPNGTSSFLRYLSEHFEFVDTNFLIQPQDDGTIRGLKFQADLTYGNDVKLKNCRFSIDSVNNVTFLGSAIETVRVISGAVSNVTVEDCWFDERFGNSVYFDRLIGTCVLRNNNYAGKISAIRMNSVGTESMTLIIDGGVVQRVSPNKLFQITNISTMNLIINRLEINESFMGFVNDSGTSSTWAPLSLSNNRIIFVSSTPTGGGFKGDTAKITTPVAGTACEWVCTVTHPTAATWIMSKQSGIKKNTTANRPLPSIIDIGLLYQDTTLNVNGKPIQWNGNIWIDFTGATV